ncbi:MAG: transglutaminase-like cysteine peptidase [Hyphomicrobiaceae bacterium]
MKRVLSSAMAIAALLVSLVPGTAIADTAKNRPSERQPSYMRVFGQAAPPYGFVQFCDRSSDECAAGTMADVRFHASPERLAELDEINRVVNAAIEPTTDAELYGVEEYWTLPNARGDCEDYALLKRHILIKRGWPVGSLLMTVVRDEKGDGHAILTARTAQGDFILDNKVAAVKPWHSTGYEYIMRQSYINPRVWMSLDPNHGQAPLAISGVKTRR